MCLISEQDKQEGMKEKGKREKWTISGCNTVSTRVHSHAAADCVKWEITWCIWFLMWQLLLLILLIDSQWIIRWKECHIWTYRHKNLSEYAYIFFVNCVLSLKVVFSISEHCGFLCFIPILYRFQIVASIWSRCWACTLRAAWLKFDRVNPEPATDCGLHLAMWVRGTVSDLLWDTWSGNSTDITLAKRHREIPTLSFSFYFQHLLYLLYCMWEPLCQRSRGGDANSTEATTATSRETQDWPQSCVFIQPTGWDRQWGYPSLAFPFPLLQLMSFHLFYTSSESSSDTELTRLVRKTNSVLSDLSTLMLQSVSHRLLVLPLKVDWEAVTSHLWKPLNKQMLPQGFGWIDSKYQWVIVWMMTPSKVTLS